MLLDLNEWMWSDWERERTKSSIILCVFICTICPDQCTKIEIGDWQSEEDTSVPHNSSLDDIYATHLSLHTC